MSQTRFSLTRRDWIRGAAIAALTLSVATGAALAAPTAAKAATKAEPAISRIGMVVSLQRFTRFAPKGKPIVYGQWSWVPRLEFYVIGPLEGGSQLTVNFLKPDGTPWLSKNVDTPEAEAGVFYQIKTEDFDESVATTGAGVFPFQIVLKNSLSGKKSVLFNGKYIVKKFKDPYDKAPGATEFYVDHDWLLALGYLTANTRVDEEAPILQAKFWVRNAYGTFKSEKLAAYIFKDGKQIASSKYTGDGRSGEISISSDKEIITPGMNRNDPSWQRVVLLMTKLRTTRVEEKRSANNYNTQIFLDKNPGDYQVKVVYDGKPIRTISFTIGKDGKLVDPGVGRALLPGDVTIVPVKIEPGYDAGADLALWKTMGFYGNPVPGLMLP